MSQQRRMLIITDGYNDLHTAKTAICLIRYRSAEVVAVLDRPAATLTALADEPPQPNRCWIAAGPDGPRLARVGGIEAEPLTLALAALDAAGIADPKEPSLV